MASNRKPGRWVRFPLSAKIVLWFFLNLAFLAGAAWIFARSQLRLGLDSLLAGPVNDHLQTMGVVLADQLQQHPESEWEQIIQSAGKAYHLRMALYRNDGEAIAGAGELPAEVRKRLLDIPPDPRAKLRPSADPQGRPLPPGFSPPAGQDRPPLADGTRSSLPSPPEDGRPDGPPPATAGGFPKMMVHTSGMYWVLIRMPVVDRRTRPPQPTTLIISTNSLREGLLFDFRPWLIGVGVVLGLSVLLWVPLVRGMTRAIREMTNAAEAIAQGRFESEVKSSRGDELGRLGGALNHMSARLREFFTGQKRFLGDIAHELCSPLARMEMALSILEQRADEKQRDYVADVRDELRHMSALVNELLSFSKAGVGGRNVELKTVPLAELAGRVVARESKEFGGVVVDVPASLGALAEPDLLSRALGNVLRNALRYASPVHSGGAGYSYRPTVHHDGRPSGPITVSARERGDRVSIFITDCGPGVPEEALHRLFDPFFRPETARTRETGGTGLGLAIVKSCIEACGGTVAVRNVQPSGLQVEFDLARAQLQSAGRSWIASTTT
jgi:two-component system sensor histidine kinase CpxA